MIFILNNLFILNLIIGILCHIILVNKFNCDQFRVLKSLLIIFIIINIKYNENQNIELKIINIYITILIYYIYFQVINLRETGRRARIIQEVCSSDIKLSEFSNYYNIAELINRRVDRLISSGRIYENNGFLYTNNDGILFVDKILNLLKQIFYGVSKLDS